MGAVPDEDEQAIRDRAIDLLKDGKNLEQAWSNGRRLDLPAAIELVTAHTSVSLQES
jgi:hypothetical protein